MFLEISNFVIGSAWRKERLVFTKKFVIFSATAGVEVIDLVPIAQITAIRSATESAANHQRHSSVIEDDDDLEVDGESPSKNSKLALELTFETQPEGYNSGRHYRVCCAP